MFVACAPGLEELVAGEVATLGLEGTLTLGGVDLRGGAGALYALNLHLRTASRVLVRVAEFRARSFIELERHARRIDWSPFVRPDAKIAVRVSSKKSKLYHERGIAERLARWIGEATGATEAGPGAGNDDDDREDGGDPGSQLIVVRFFRDGCTISADSSGEHLHRRGYRRAVGKAPLRETLAAALLIGGGWRGETPLIDPLCGSGTIPIEAALIARRIAPGLGTAGRSPRSYAFQRWPSFDPVAWEEVVKTATASILEVSPIPIAGSDRDAGAIEGARGNAARAGVEIAFETAPLSAALIPAGSGHLAVNPPYGVRVGESRPLRDLYAALGKVVRTKLSGWAVAMLAADEALVRQTGLPMGERLRTSNGGLSVGLYTTSANPAKTGIQEG